MSLDSAARRGRSAAKRRRIDTTGTTVVESDRAIRSSPRIEQATGQQRPSSPATLAPQPRAVVRPPEAPFHPGAIELWVVRDSQGKKQLTTKLTPGCRHWRIGDPNVPFCFKCRKEGDLLGCRTCKRSYHLACLGERSLTKGPSKDAFYCPLCLERGWDVQAPPEILPLTPASSRETSPAPTGARNVTAADAPSWMEQLKEAQNIAATGNEPKEPTSNAKSHNSIPGQTAFAAVDDATAPAAVPQQVSSMTPTRKAPTTDGQVSTLMRTYDLQPPPASSSARPASHWERAKAGRPKSRYQTMPDEVDQALTVIYRELEAVTALRQDLAALQDQFKTTEQARKILEGQLALELSGHASIAQKDTEIQSLKRHVADLKKAHDSLLNENSQLRERLQSDENTNKAELEEMQALKASLRRLLGE